MSKKGMEKSRSKLKIIWWEKQGIGLHHNFPKVSHYHLHFFAFLFTLLEYPQKTFEIAPRFLLILHHNTKCNVYFFAPHAHKVKLTKKLISFLAYSS